jgi:serine/threonine protein kinase/Tfp pilus assembly protein PilF
VPLARGTLLGPYEIVAPLGAGGMGEVYRAHDSRLGRDVAIKVIAEARASSPERRARFEREARTVAGLNHPNIVTLHSIEDFDGTRFLTMELIEGRDLSSVVTPGGLPTAQVLEIVIPLADALVAAHERHVVHRDLKPSNVMLTRAGHVKVLDFGLARMMEAGAELDLTQTISVDASISQTGHMVGTVPYMAPEQIRGEEVDARADLFSFGILVYELAAGRRPFNGTSSAEISSAILRDAPPELVSVRADLPSDLGRIVERCLEKNPRERFQTALDVANELRALKRLLERGAPATARPSPENTASIAILPFVNRGPSAEDEYFSDGLADELLNLLTKIRGLKVAARSSSFHFKGKDATIAEVGRLLNVAAVLEGSVRKAGPRVRISVQLVKVADGYHLWSETYDRTLEDIFAVQDDIARAVVKEVRAALLGEIADSRASGEVRAEVSRAAKGRTTNAEAYRLYLQGQHFMIQRAADDHARAIQCARQALSLDPQFARAWVLLAQLHNREANQGQGDVAERFQKAREAADRALALEPDMPEALGQLALTQLRGEWDWHGAEATLHRRARVGPLGAMDAAVAMRFGRLDEAIRIHRQIIEQNPLAAAEYHNLGRVLYEAGRFVESEAAFRQALEFTPRRNVTRADCALALLEQDRGEEGLAMAGDEPGESWRLWALAIIQGRVRGREEAERTLQQLIEKHGHTALYQIAQVYASLGETDNAFAWLDRAYASRDPGLPSVGHSRLFLSLHRDPRWKPLLRRMGFDE